MGCDQFEQQTRNAFEIDALHPIQNSLYEQIRFPPPSESGEEATLLDQHRWRCLQQSELPAIPSSRNAQRFLQKIRLSVSLSSRLEQPANPREGKSRQIGLTLTVARGEGVNPNLLIRSQVVSVRLHFYKYLSISI